MGVRSDGSGEIECIPVRSDGSGEIECIGVRSDGSGDGIHGVGSDGSGDQIHRGLVSKDRGIALLRSGIVSFGSLRGSLSSDSFRRIAIFDGEICPRTHFYFWVKNGHFWSKNGHFLAFLAKNRNFARICCKVRTMRAKWPLLGEK